MQLNAVPWADVTIDGTAVGETPLGNVPVSIGPHTLVFRHPQLGEQTRTVVVTTQSPPRISVDLRK
jgi:serine/threonine-protein kinase